MRTIFSTVTIVAALNLIPFQNALALPPKSGWALEQENPYAPSGKWTMTLGNSGIKTVDKNINLIIIAPAYNAYVTNTATKQYSAATYAEWLQTFFHKS